MATLININQTKNEETTKLKHITPVILDRWSDRDKILMEYPFTDGRISIDEYNIAHRGKPKRADYLLLHKDNIPLAIVEAKGADHRADEGYAQAVDYARILDVPFAYATNGDDLIERDMITGLNRNMKMADFPTDKELWERYKKETAMTQAMAEVYTYPYFTTATGKKPRYYQRIAINRTVQAIEKGKRRVLLTLATGTGKTFTAFQIIHRFWSMRKFKKILFLADRNILVDQTMRKDFKPFAAAMEKIDNRSINTSKEVFLGLYQQLKTGETDYYKQLPRDFFDLIVIDECHRGSASKDSNWHDILTYFAPAVQIGLTATPKDGGVQEAWDVENEAKRLYEEALKENDNAKITRYKKSLERAVEKREKAESESSASYFGNPIYTYSLKQGIEDGYLSPYRVINVELNIDKLGWLPPEGTKDVDGNEVPRVTYQQADFDKKIVSIDRRKMVAKRISDFLKTNDMRYAKTIVFCEDISHCEEMVRLLENENSDLVAENPLYITQITGDNDAGKAQLDNFIDPSSKYPVIAVTSRLMSTGVDAETCEVVVLDRTVGSMTEFKQIIGRGTRVKPIYECDGETKSKMYFTVLDFRRNYLKFNDASFDGVPVTVTDVPPDGPFPIPPIRPGDKPKTDGHGGGGTGGTPHRVARINGIEVHIENEDVWYRDSKGNLVKQDITSCTRNNIVGQYSTFEEFHAAWMIAKDKERMANELLIEIDWSESFEKQYGYKVDAFDIIAKIGYDVEPPMSKRQRTESAAIALYLSGQSDEKKMIIRMMLDVYAVSSFNSLRAIKEIFAMPKFTEAGYTPIKVIKQVFGSREKYFEELPILENKLYE